jgi:ABC-type transport system involved in cytochrome bd biosynthesis fused ATPase/permease subunit
MIELKKYFQFILIGKEKINILLCFILTTFIAIIETFGIGLIPTYIYSILEPEKAIKIIEDFTTINFSNFFDSSAKDLNKFFALIILMLFIFKNILLFLLTMVLTFLYLSIREGVSYRVPKWFVKISYIDYLNYNSSEIIRNVTTETINTTNCLRDIILLINDLLLITFVIIFLSYSLPGNFVGAIFSIILVTLILSFMSKSQMKKWGDQGVKQRNYIIKFTNHIFNSFKELKIFGNEKFLLDNYKKILSENIMVIKKTNLLNILNKYLIEIAAIITILVAILILLNHSNNNLVNNLVPLSLFGAALSKLVPSFYKLNSQYLKIQSAHKSVEIIYNLKKQITVNEKEFFQNKTIQDFTKSLEFKNVSFKYKNRKKTLENINFKIINNQITLITGRSGSGKSTLVDLICGIIKPDEGKIFLNNENIYSENNYIKLNISYMPQKIYLLDDTIKNNIVFQSYKNINKIHLKKIIKDVGLTNFIDTLPNNINEFIGENAKKLSGGQIKRIGLARSLYKNKKTLILDEPTAGLDEKSSQEIVKLLKTLSLEKNIFIISHDESFEEISDNIFECKNFTLYKKK